MKIGRIFFLVALIISAVVLGGLFANLCQDVSFLSWLNYEKSIGLSIDNPAVINLSVIKIVFGFELGINISQVIFLLASVYIYQKFKKHF